MDYRKPHRRCKHGFKCTKSSVRMCDFCKGTYKRTVNKNCFVVVDMKEHHEKKKYLVRSLDKGDNWKILKNDSHLKEDHEIRVIRNFCNDYANLHTPGKLTSKSPYLVLIYMPKGNMKKYVNYCSPRERGLRGRRYGRGSKKTKKYKDLQRVLSSNL